MKVLILGSTGFVGRNLVEVLSTDFTIIRTSRQKSGDESVYFDLYDVTSWRGVVDLNPDVIINAVAYGVIKHEVDLQKMYDTNYFLIADFYTFMHANNCSPFWMQLGTAFEYDLLRAGGISEQSKCLPRTHYGISKLMFSQFLIGQEHSERFAVLRPFGMFGKYEDESKFFPMLIKSQQNKTPIKLSAGTQQRDYFFAGDLGIFIRQLILQKRLGDLPKVLNLGSGTALSFRAYADVLSKFIRNFDPLLWQWDQIGFRPNESGQFYNKSLSARNLGFETRSLEDAFVATAEYYFST